MGFDRVVRGGSRTCARCRRRSSTRAPQRTVAATARAAAPRADRAPILLIPPLAAPASCFDLRRGCSLAEHLLAAGYPTYVVDYGPIAFGDRNLGLEHWVDEVIPRAIEPSCRRRRRRQVQLVGWCLGGIMTLLTVASDQELPIALGRAGREPVRLDPGAAGGAAAPARRTSPAARSGRSPTACSAARPRRWSAAHSSSPASTST